MRECCGRDGLGREWLRLKVVVNEGDEKIRIKRKNKKKDYYVNNLYPPKSQNVFRIVYESYLKIYMSV